MIFSTADNFCKQCGPRPSPAKYLASSGSKLFDILMVFLKLIDSLRILCFQRKHRDEFSERALTVPSASNQMSMSYFYLPGTQKYAADDVQQTAITKTLVSYVARD